MYMTKKQKALAAIEALKKVYPDAECALIHSNPLELLIATRLSIVLKKKLQNISVPVVCLKQRHAIFLQCVKN